MPAVYTGTMYAYVLNKESVGNAGSSWEASDTTDPSGRYGYIYNHSLFVTTVRVTRSWNEMNQEDLIFGRSIRTNGVTSIPCARPPAEARTSALPAPDRKRICFLSEILGEDFEK